MRGALLEAAVESRRFFQLAATIIPIVLFGSVLARAFRPPRTHTKLRWYHGLAALVVALYVAFVSSAEVFAIAVTVDGGAEDVIRIGVSAALILAIFGFGLAITVPWANRFRLSGKSHWLGIALVGICFVLAFGWGSQKLLELATRGGIELSTEARISHVLADADQAELEWLRAEIRAHVDHEVDPLEKQELALLGRLKLSAKQNERRVLRP